MAKARFLHETNTIADQAAQEHVSQTFSTVQDNCFPANSCIHIIFCVHADLSCRHQVLQDLVV